MTESSLKSTGSANSPDPSEEWAGLIQNVEMLIDKQDYEEAERLALRALEFAETFAVNDRRLGVTLELLSQLYFFAGQFQYGAPVIMRLLQMYRRLLGHNHVDTATITYNAAVLYHSWRKFEEAGVFYQQAMYIKACKLGSDHPEVESIRKDYAVYLRDASRTKGRVTRNLRAIKAPPPESSRDKMRRSGQWTAVASEMTDHLQSDS
ncbi:MAG: tetratricopeptide repeat protein [Cyanobacteria bacterium]|nr:tetratricopeptide repeat protein [Cyanobacteriota bacterium]